MGARIVSKSFSSSVNSVAVVLTAILVQGLGVVGFRGEGSGFRVHGLGLEPRVHEEVQDLHPLLRVVDLARRAEPRIQRLGLVPPPLLHDEGGSLRDRGVLKVRNSTTSKLNLACALTIGLMIQPAPSHHCAC